MPTQASRWDLSHRCGSRHADHASPSGHHQQSTQVWWSSNESCISVHFRPFAIVWLRCEQNVNARSKSWMVTGETWATTSGWFTMFKRLVSSTVRSIPSLEIHVQARPAFPDPMAGSSRTLILYNLLQVQYTSLDDRPRKHVLNILQNCFKNQDFNGMVFNPWYEETSIEASIEVVYFRIHSAPFEVLKWANWGNQTQAWPTRPTSSLNYGGARPALIKSVLSSLRVWYSSRRVISGWKKPYPR